MKVNAPPAFASGAFTSIKYCSPYFVGWIERNETQKYDHGCFYGSIGQWRDRIRFSSNRYTVY